MKKLFNLQRNIFKPLHNEERFLSIYCLATYVKFNNYDYFHFRKFVFKKIQNHIEDVLQS